EILHVVRLGAVELEPGILDGVLGLGRRSEHPVGDCSQVWPVLLEPLRQPVSLFHRSHPFQWVRHGSDGRKSAVVTSVSFSMLSFGAGNIRRNPMTASILVTGGTGTLGQHVVPKLLSSGRDVRILSRQAGDGA